MRQDLDFLQFVKFLLCFLGDVRFSLVLQQQSAFATNEGRVLLLHLVIDTVQLLAVEFGIHDTAIQNQFKVKYTLKLPPDANHHLLAETRLTRNWWRMLTSRNPLLLPVVIDQVNPVFVGNHNTLLKSIIQWTFQQLTADYSTTLGLRFGQLVWILARPLVHKIYLVQVTEHSTMGRDCKNRCKFTAAQ